MGNKIVLVSDDSDFFEYIGTKLDIQTSKKFWDQFIPTLQKKIDQNWTYNGSNIDFQQGSFNQDEYTECDVSSSDFED